MRADFKVVIDACVLANHAVCDLLLTLAESPRLYLPRWSNQLLQETYHTHTDKLGWDKSIADKFQKALMETFPEALVHDYEHLIPHCDNSETDRHVLACAIHCKAEIILTYNLKDFPKNFLFKWDIIAQHPQDYLLVLYSISPAIVIIKLKEISDRLDMDFEDYLINLGKFLPKFSLRLLNDLSIG